MRFIISINESIYIIYMFNYFKTSIYLSHPFDIFTSKIKFIDHSEKDNHICLIGNLLGFLLPIWLLGRHFINSKIVIKYNKIIMNIILICSLLTNMNAFIYFLPLYINNLYFIS